MKNKENKKAVMLKSFCSASQPLSKKQRDPEQRQLRMTRRVRAFTLIELLVVVLIIGILSAIALPQYQVSVMKSRYTQLKTMVRSIRDAQEAYRLENGEYAKEFGHLPIDIGGTSATTDTNRTFNWGVCTVTQDNEGSVNGVICNNKDELGLNYNFSTQKFYCMVQEDKDESGPVHSGDGFFCSFGYIVHPA